jgi:hypothetical protein
MRNTKLSRRIAVRGLTLAAVAAVALTSVPWLHGAGRNDGSRQSASWNSASFKVSGSADTLF